MHLYRVALDIGFVVLALGGIIAALAIVLALTLVAYLIWGCIYHYWLLVDWRSRRAKK